ncbi:hypothetical protein [Thermohalobaculum xanthum]|nr:hypothetical protein [Thermohalobaculum xanthum]
MGLIGFLVISVLLIVPFWKLLPRFGIPSWVALAAIIPLGAIVLLWVMAFRDKLGGQGRF